MSPEMGRMNNRNLQLWALDVETSGLDPKECGVLSVALRNYDTGEYIYREVEFEKVETSVEGILGIRSEYYPHILKWDEESANIHKLTPWQGKGNKASEVDEEISEWIRERGTQYVVTRKPMGLNVGTFDLPFLRERLPLVAESLSYQCVDLNALYIAIAYTRNTSLTTVKRGITEMAIKGAKKLHPDLELHHSLFDATLSCFCWAESLGCPVPWMKTEGETE